MAMMLLGRIIAGFSVGLLSGNAPVYTSEIAPPKMRGALVTGFQFAVTATCFKRRTQNGPLDCAPWPEVGIMLAFLLALVLEEVEEPVSGWRWVIAAQRLNFKHGRQENTRRSSQEMWGMFFWVLHQSFYASFAKNTTLKTLVHNK